MADRSFRYLLGDSADEAHRLAAQAALWDPVSHALFDRLEIERDWRVLEIGPGAGSLHVELRRRVHAPVDAVEQSSAFCSALVERSRGDGFGPGRIWNDTLANAALPASQYDLIFARWVFLFLPEPAQHLEKLARSLKPGGLIAVQDYFRDTLCLIPKPADWDAFLAADRAFFASQGGDANIGTRLPLLYENAGLEVLDVVPTTKSGHPGSAVWNWITGYFFGVFDQLATLAPLTKEATNRISRAWRAAERQRPSLLIAPTVLDVVGKKPSAR